MKEKQAAKLAAKKEGEAVSNQRKAADEKRAQEASKVEAALVFMNKQTTTKESKMEHYKVIITALEHYRAGLVTGSSFEDVQSARRQKGKKL